ncbi:hypothetical protein F511_17095 [Dorcoceras hygrometricum]|uniref:Uncharacterized protein n=1 Tax=Dorcoceras hygrometricum TaxID=472368 RepID=A0A2Z7BK64_9LAMI|nr:hypothetical protein F511_17095 [Dorcoceras hygrometricum]
MLQSFMMGVSRIAGPRDPLFLGYPRMSASGESSTTMHRLLHASGPHPIPPPNDPKTNQYNQDLGLIHSTNGNHLESPNEGSSIDHQVTIYLHVQNITMFPTNETWYFASQILVSSSGGLILILTLRPVSRGNRHFTVGSGRLRQSGPRPEGRLLRQPALECLTRSVRTDSPRKVDRNKSDHLAAAAAAMVVPPAAAAFEEMREAARLATSPHDPLGITDSACKNQLVVVSVQYSPFNPYIPIRSTTIGKSRVVKDPIAMHTSWRSNSDIASVTSIGYPRMSVSGESSTTMHRLLHASGSHPIPPSNDPKTNQYNQDLGLIHSTNGNHLESPNEGSSIDHQIAVDNRQSGPRPESRLLRQAALEALTNSARTDSPRRIGRNGFRRLEAAATAAAQGGGDGGVCREEGRRLSKST